MPLCLEALANGADAPVHHVGGREDVGAGLRLHQRLAHERFERLVVGDLRAAHEAVVAVAGVGVERHVEDDADVEARRLDRARRPAHEVLRIERLARILGAQLGLGVGKERDRGNAEACCFSRRGDDIVDRQALHARHGGDRHALVGAVDDEERPDQIADIEPVLGDETA